MSQHPSLRVDKVGSRHRNVLKRYEKLDKLKAEERWSEDQPVYSLPKVKSQKLKAKKGKSGAKDEAADAKDKDKK